MAKLRCRPGDLAIISRCGNKRYIGLLVRVDRRCTALDFDWIVEFLGGAVPGHEIGTGAPGDFTHAPVWDWNLTPLAEVEPESIEEQEASHA
ncbi:hypothetical protein BLA9940_05941 [Burkholderia aenigmatica]|uniref:hypothetical protein n=1 Tax=Burkholderia cepacia complex TaxID=87882 RepID=UPI000F07CC22|nr:MULTISPECIES: hypothetical protein [Burkholderia cepacia complex]AYQ37634.1 hypothetical protein CVS37_05545 [Burkholderia lata]VWC98104.1 hypothetical protein BLA9940_05941 [Burkholderia aenigmatica]